jgi:hypothetical protein
MFTLKWQNLKKNKCPQCGDSLSAAGELIVCAGACGFKISKRKMQKIVMDQNNQALRKQKYSNNEEALNNF